MEKVLPALRFIESREAGYIATPMRGEVPTGVIPLTSPRKLVQTRKQARTRRGRKHANDRCVK